MSPWKLLRILLRLHFAAWMRSFLRLEIYLCSIAIWTKTRICRSQSFQVLRSAGPKQTRRFLLQLSSSILSSVSRLSVDWTSSIGVGFVLYSPGYGSASIPGLRPHLISSPTSLILLTELGFSWGLMNR